MTVDVLFEQPGQHALEHRTPDRSYRLATITVAEEPAEPPLAEGFRESGMVFSFTVDP